MFERRRKLSLSAVCLLSLFGFARDGFSQAGGEAEWKKVLEAARKEGKVVVAVQPGPEIRQGLEKGFGEKFKGVQLELLPGASTANAVRIINESKAGIRNFDVFISGTGVQLSVASEGALEPLDPYMVLPEVKDPKQWFGGHIWADNVTAKHLVYVFHAYLTEPAYYNAPLLNPEEIRSYDGLLNPKWKGKIGIHEPRVQGAGQAIWIYLWKVKGEAFLTKLVEQDLFVSTDHRQLGDALAKGKLALVLGPTYYTLLPYIQAGIPLKALPTPKEGIHATSGSGGISIVKNPPHPNAAKVFVNWLLSKEGQEIFGKATGQATRRLDVDTKWLQGIGVQAAKDFLTIEEYLERESFFENRIPLRKPAQELAQKLLK